MDKVQKHNSLNTLVSYNTTRRHNPEDLDFIRHRRETLRTRTGNSLRIL